MLNIYVNNDQGKWSSYLSKEDVLIVYNKSTKFDTWWKLKYTKCNTTLEILEYCRSTKPELYSSMLV